jgi:hypothetical protein
MAEHTPTLGEVAELIRSKNAGPFWMTIDVFFATDADYRCVDQSGVLTEEVVARLYRVDPAGVAVHRVPAIRVIKVSFPRPVSQGSFADRDLHAGQQHVPLAGLPLTARS